MANLHLRFGQEVAIRNVWSTNGTVYARSRDGGTTFSQPMPIGRISKAPSRPYVIAGPQGAAIVWKEFDGEKTLVNLITSADDGKTWSEPRIIATTSDESDPPALVWDGRQYYLSWMTKADGYHLQPIESEPGSA